MGKGSGDMMLKYIKSELYRVMHLKSVYITSGVCIGLLLAMNLVLWGFAKTTPDFSYDTTRFSFSMLYTGMMVPFMMTIVFASIIFSNENKSGTLRNSIAFGLSRYTILIGKWIVTLFSAFVCLFVIILIFVGSSYLLLENSNVGELQELLNAIWGCIPLFIAATTGGLVFLLLIDSETMAVWAWFGIMVGVPIITNLLGLKFSFFQWFGKWTLLNLIQTQAGTDSVTFIWSTAEGLKQCFIAGILGTIVFIAIGIIGYRKKELK